jgi:hypothetical protein
MLDKISYFIDYNIDKLYNNTMLRKEIENF